MSQFDRCKRQGQSCDEHGASFEIINTSGAEIEKFKVEDCLIVEGRKCDFLFEVRYATRKKDMAVYVELKKGWRYDIGIEQIRDTAAHELMRQRHHNMKRIGIIAGAPPSPKITSTMQDEIDLHSGNLMFLIKLSNSIEV